jgi:wyosine [tRNA(Phe)-imidazoG37] synthetase (radical SAM superfamily)
MTYVYGPVPSRRLGRSLGVDPIPLKTCNWNCVYCQLGYTAPLTAERRDYAPPDEIVRETLAALEAHAGAVDWITFVGSGEPTLHASLGRMIREVKARTAVPVAVITNGSLLHRPDVRGDLLPADAVLPTLDAGTEDLYLRINRPLPEFTFARLVEGLVAFRAEYRGRLWVEVMLVKGLNDSEEALSDIAAVLRRVGPDEVHLNVPVRPPAEPWVEPPDEAGLARARRILGPVAHTLTAAPELAFSGDTAEEIARIVRCHPMAEEEVLRALPPGEGARILAQLLSKGLVQVVVRGGRRFLSASGSRYVGKHGGSGG